MKGFASIDATNIWWTRSLGEQDKVVVHSSLKKLSEFHQANFIRTDAPVTRSNGIIGRTLEVRKAPNSKFVMKFRGEREVLSFKLESKGWRRGGGHGEINEECRSWSRIVSNRNQQALTKELLLENLVLQSAEKTLGFMELSEHITEAQDEKGPYLELALDETPELFKINLPTRPASTYVKTGVYRIECMEQRPSTQDTNEEGQMVINVESFIEKND
jgi:hypothetical protein